ncbi:hypothetical protein HF520_14790 [Romboutsia sp. CE17]|uniref:hypothetical protein n=1 Tax=Romboutsia sp. CE17 TaxID=2724150 RepID=UPI001442DD37|nr:hypothetical protein [Romboutsia sp. CE17]QJA10046.1 hypothetical protein HF520_14790 [Romboutsia sp. CE17]
MKRSLSRREKILSIIFIITIIFSSYKIYNNNEKYYTATDSLNEVNNSKPMTNVKTQEKDIILEIENEIKDIVEVKYINKTSYLDNDNQDIVNVELHIRGKIDDIFKVESSLINIGLEKNIKKLNIIRNINNMSDNKKEDIKNYVDCIMEIKVI